MGCDSDTVPESEHGDKTRDVHRTNTQNMELAVGWGHRMPPPIQRGRKDRGHFPSRKKAEQILLFGDKTSHERRLHLLGGTYTCRSGPGRMAFDLGDSGGYTWPVSPHLHGGTPLLGKHLVMGRPHTHGWIKEAILDGSLLAVTDGSFLHEHYPDLCSAAFVLECTRGRGRMFGSFSESSRVANAYRGELLGLMAIHLILLSMDKVHSGIAGSVTIVSDCLGGDDGWQTYHLTGYHQDASTLIF
jgi:hypothetical protein